MVNFKTHFSSTRGVGLHLSGVCKPANSFKYELKRPKRELLKIKNEVIGGLQHIVKNRLLIHDFRNIDDMHELSIVYYEKRGEYVINKKFPPDIEYDEAIERLEKSYKELNKYKFDVEPFDDVFAKLIDVYEDENLAKFYDFGTNAFGKDFELYTNILLNIEYEVDDYV